jgi:two-component system cell cycle sensor histidine kinase/response regulator CckA
MARPLRVLFVEDREKDVELLVLELRRGGYDPVYERVDTREALASALDRQGWDVILCDYQMPRLSAPAALALSRDKKVDLPFIVVSGTIGEETAVEALRAGANDFMTKDKLARLLPAIDRELREAASRQARRLAEESNQKLLQAVGQAKNAIFMTDPDGAITYANPAFEEIYGYSMQEVIGKTPRILKSGQHDQTFYERFWQTLLAGESVREEFVNKRRDGRLVTVEASVSPVLDSQGMRIGFIAVQDDITERKRTEESLRKSERRFSLAFHASPLPTSIREIEMDRYVDVNDQFVRILGYPREELIGRTPSEVGLFVDSGVLKHIADGIVREAAVVQLEIQLRGRSGEIHDVVGSATRIEVGSMPCVLATFLDVTERKLVEKELHRSEERFRKLFESNTIGISVADLSGRILEANDAYLAMIGYTREELLSGVVRWDDLTPAEYRGRDQIAVEQLQKTGIAQPWEKEILRKDGSRVPILLGVAMLEASEGSCLAYIVDLSSQRRLEKEFRQAQKMEAIGQLAGGIAHDFNNLLTAILGYGELLASKLPSDSRLQEEIGEIRGAGQRAASLTRQLLAFSRQQVLEPVVLSLNELITNFEKMLGRLIGEDVKLVTRLDPLLGNVRADPGQLEQVIMNLAVNARDAMPNGGKLTIETANADLDESYAQRHVTVQPGRYVMVAVNDTGTGMDAETQAHIFEPFFTTKEKEKGTGLGLSTVYGIVKQSGGNIWVYSEPGKGTTIKVYLPRVEEAFPAAPPGSSDSLPTLGTETILIVEDEQAIRVLARRVLEESGYHVLEAGDGESALELMRTHPEQLHLLLTDLVMPDMGGTELASRLQDKHPTIRVLFMSGYTDDGVVRNGLLGPGRAFLQKPFTPSMLVRKIRDVLA